LTSDRKVTPAQVSNRSPRPRATSAITFGSATPTYMRRPQWSLKIVLPRWNPECPSPATSWHNVRPPIQTLWVDLGLLVVLGTHDDLHLAGLIPLWNWRWTCDLTFYLTILAGDGLPLLHDTEIALIECAGISETAHRLAQHVVVALERGE